MSIQERMRTELSDWTYDQIGRAIGRSNNCVARAFHYEDGATPETLQRLEDLLDANKANPGPSPKGNWRLSVYPTKKKAQVKVRFFSKTTL